jgi:hypothetical protein
MLTDFFHLGYGGINIAVVWDQLGYRLGALALEFTPRKSSSCTGFCAQAL